MKDFSTYLYMFLIVPLLTQLLLCIIFELFSSTAIAGSPLMNRVLFHVDRELVAMVREMGTAPETSFGSVITKGTGC